MAPTSMDHIAVLAAPSDRMTLFMDIVKIMRGLPRKITPMYSGREYF